MSSSGYRVLEDGPDVFRLDEEAGMRLVDGALHAKLVTASGDPVELNAVEARLLGEAFLRFAARLEAELAREPPRRS